MQVQDSNKIKQKFLGELAPEISRDSYVWFVALLELKGMIASSNTVNGGDTSAKARENVGENFLFASGITIFRKSCSMGVNLY